MKINNNKIKDLIFKVLIFYISLFLNQLYFKKKISRNF